MVWQRLLASVSSPSRKRSLRRFLTGQLKGGNGTSLLYFTMHKCASMFAGQVLSEVSRSAGLPAIDFEGATFLYGTQILRDHLTPEIAAIILEKQQDANQVTPEQWRRLVPPQGYLIGPLRMSPWVLDLPHRDEFRIVLQLRDPRDVLTSSYFSIAYSHAIPSGNETVRQKLLERRGRTLEMSIDEYVLAKSRQCAKRYGDYCRALLGSENVLVVRYEDMVSDFPNWLQTIVDFWGIEPGTRTMRRLIGQADFSVDDEDPSAHKRQVQPGDHRRKLRPETIAALNERFADAMHALGYAAHPGSSARAA